MISNILDRTAEWNFEIDEYLNRILPPSPLHKFPPRVSRFLGYRKEHRQDIGNIPGAWWSLLGAFCGLAVIAAVFNNTESIQARHPPAFIASFGASAILEYNAIRSPLGQPRNALLGHTFSALVGVGITKLFLLHSEFKKIRWIAGAVSCGTASAVMLLTGTVHPPGGASAVLAAIDPAVTAMGWYFVGLVMYGTTLMLLVSLIINNIQRQFPMYWWSPLEVGKAWRKDEHVVPDGRGGLEPKETPEEREEKAWQIHVSGHHISLPDELSLNPQEVQMLENLRERLRRRIVRDMAGEEAGRGEDYDEDEKEKDVERVPSSRPSTDDTVVGLPSRGHRSDSSSSALRL